eukprot:scaffold20274_cov13-Tisochrysis_lutea.AAC.2
MGWVKERENNACRYAPHTTGRNQTCYIVGTCCLLVHANGCRNACGLPPSFCLPMLANIWRTPAGQPFPKHGAFATLFSCMSCT